MSNIVAIVGRPNVGKSTLFNRFTQTRQAITDEISGVTRDRHYGKAEWNGREFSVIDTGGYVQGSDDIFESEIRKQVQLAIDEASIILFLVDATSGVTHLDEAVVKLLRRSNKKVILAVNKVDNKELLDEAVEFYSLGLGSYIPLSSISGSGTGELLDELVANFLSEDDMIDSVLPKFAVIGRPNVGKSSVINALIGKEQNIVTDIAGTTRDSLDTKYNQFGFDFILVDTAGLRNTDDEIESKGIEITKAKISKASVLIYLFDINDSTESEIINDLKEFSRDDLSIILVRNKIDLKNESSTEIKSILEKCDDKVKEILEISAIQKKYLDVIKNKLLELNKVSKNEDTIVTNLRHFNSLSNAESALIEIEKGINEGLSGDLLSIDLRKAIDSIGEITGQITNDEMLGNIFSNFCIGK